MMVGLLNAAVKCLPCHKIDIKCLLLRNKENCALSW